MKGKEKGMTDEKKLRHKIRAQRNHIRKVDRELVRLKSEVKTLQKALDESVVYINDELADVPVDDIVKYFSRVNKPKKLDSVKAIVTEKLDELDEKWRCFKCTEGFLKMIMFNRHDGQYYFRSCSNIKCEHRTKVKPVCDAEEL